MTQENLWEIKNDSKAIYKPMSELVDKELEIKSLTLYTKDDHEGLAIDFNLSDTPQDYVTFTYSRRLIHFAKVVNKISWSKIKVKILRQGRAYNIFEIK